MQEARRMTKKEKTSLDENTGRALLRSDHRNGSEGVACSPAGRVRGWEEPTAMIQRSIMSAFGKSRCQNTRLPFKVIPTTLWHFNISRLLHQEDEDKVKLIYLPHISVFDHIQGKHGMRRVLLLCSRLPVKFHQNEDIVIYFDT